MTTTKGAAGLVERLEGLGALAADEIYLEPVHVALREAAQEIRTLHAQVEELRRERDTCFQSADDNARAVNVAEARATKAEAGIAEAVKALEPFAKVTDCYTEDANPDEGIEVGLTLGECRAARAFVEKHKESGNGR